MFLTHIKCPKLERTVDKITAALIALITITVLLYCYSAGISGNDFWWHIKVGEWIYKNGQIPVTDVFS